MNGIAQVAALLSGIVYVAVSPLEMFFYDRPAVRRWLHVDTTDVADVRMWAFVVGVRNLLGGAGALIGLLILHSGNEPAGHAVTLSACWYMLLAGLAMGLADLLGFWRPRGGSVLGTIGSSVLPLVAIVAASV
ncbi:DUF1304 family protein [Nocardia farcinica]|uniref:DUF1304 domain-containing protein n=1 Tax=Nocardia farcinica (strain IFM 10152) TaxID=247156 RepID=Q5YTC6_NOCFA|nr:DUF1304 family protein [Nocardia farcinica]BAD58565.1 hypothetical protein NFA_37170 [Nocardia farcinica IFM 10152]